MISGQPGSYSKVYRGTNSIPRKPLMETPAVSQRHDAAGVSAEASSKLDADAQNRKFEAQSKQQQYAGFESSSGQLSIKTESVFLSGTSHIIRDGGFENVSITSPVVETADRLRLNQEHVATADFYQYHQETAEATTPAQPLDRAAQRQLLKDRKAENVTETPSKKSNGSTQAYSPLSSMGSLSLDPRNELKPIGGGAVKANMIPGKGGNGNLAQAIQAQRVIEDKGSQPQSNKSPWQDIASLVDIAQDSQFARKRLPSGPRDIAIGPRKLVDQLLSLTPMQLMSEVIFLFWATHGTRYTEWRLSQDVSQQKYLYLSYFRDKLESMRRGDLISARKWLTKANDAYNQRDDRASTDDPIWRLKDVEELEFHLATVWYILMLGKDNIFETLEWAGVYAGERTLKAFLQFKLLLGYFSSMDALGDRSKMHRLSAIRYYRDNIEKSNSEKLDINDSLGIVFIIDQLVDRKQNTMNTSNNMNNYDDGIRYRLPKELWTDFPLSKYVELVVKNISMAYEGARGDPGYFLPGPHIPYLYLKDPTSQQKNSGMGGHVSRLAQILEVPNATLFEKIKFPIPDQELFRNVLPAKTVEITQALYVFRKEEPGFPDIRPGDLFYIYEKCKNGPAMGYNAVTKENTTLPKHGWEPSLMPVYEIQEYAAQISPMDRTRGPSVTGGPKIKPSEESINRFTTDLFQAIDSNSEKLMQYVFLAPWYNCLDAMLINGERVLSFCISRQRFEAAKALIRLGADVDAAEALHWTMKLPILPNDIVDGLMLDILSAGANVSRTDVDNRKPSWYVKRGCRRAAILLIWDGYPPDPYHEWLKIH